MLNPEVAGESETVSKHGSRGYVPKLPVNQRREDDRVRSHKPQDVKKPRAKLRMEGQVLRPEFFKSHTAPCH